MRKGHLLSALLLALVLLLGLLPAAQATDYSLLPSPARRERPELPEKRLYFHSLLAGRAYMLNDESYMAIADLARLYDIELQTELEEASFRVSAPSLELEGAQDSGYIIANGRYLYVPNGYIASGEDVYPPLDTLERIFGVPIEERGERLDISTVQCRLIVGGEDYYRMNFSAEELYWLPRIAYVESKEQPLAGLMGVCQVVLNRVESEDFPDTIFEVIYDNEYGVQFTPAATGSIQGRPDEISTIAAYLTLEGYNEVADSLYFVNPANNGNYWFRQQRSYVTTIGDHEFYK